MEKKLFIEYLNVDTLKYDPKNPRLPHSIVNSEDEKDVINWMLTDASIIELMGSIGEKGFFPAEPLLVIRDTKNKSKYLVIEGNRRLTAVKLLLKPGLANKRIHAIKQISQEAKLKPQNLPVLIFDKRSDILDYLGFKHITGVKPWSALAKAKYLRELQAEYKKLPIQEQYKKLAKAIGSRSDYVKELLIGLELYDRIHDNNFFNIDGLNEDTIDFGVYYNALKYSGIPEYVGIDKLSEKSNYKINNKKLENLTRWLSEKDNQGKTKLGESRNLSKLNNVIQKPKALELFISGRSIDDALMYTEEPYELFKNSIIESLNHIKEAHNNFPLVLEVKQTDLETLNELYNTVSDLRDIVELRIQKPKGNRR